MRQQYTRKWRINGEDSSIKEGEEGEYGEVITNTKIWPRVRLWKYTQLRKVYQLGSHAECRSLMKLLTTGIRKKSCHARVILHKWRMRFNVWSEKPQEANAKDSRTIHTTGAPRLLFSESRTSSHKGSDRQQRLVVCEQPLPSLELYVDDTIVVADDDRLVGQYTSAYKANWLRGRPTDYLPGDSFTVVCVSYSTWRFRKADSMYS